MFLSSKIFKLSHVEALLNVKKVIRGKFNSGLAHTLDFSLNQWKSTKSENRKQPSYLAQVNLFFDLG